MEFVRRTLRRAVVAVVALVVAWSFFDVGRRAWSRRQASATRPVELTVMHWGDPTEDAIVDGLVKRFVAEHGDVRVVRVNPGAAHYPTKLKTMMAGGIAPDVFYLPPQLLPELVENKLILPLDRYFDPEPAAMKDDFWPILKAAFRYDGASGLLGRGPLWALPKDFTTTCFFVNTDLFEKAGVDWRDIQKNGWDWPRFERETAKVKALAGTPGFEGRAIYGSLLQLWDDPLRNILWTYGADFFKARADGSPDFTALALTDPAAQRAMEMIRRVRLVDKTAFNATGIARDGGQEFKNGNIGCIGPLGHWLVPQYAGLTGFKWDCVPVPSGTRKASQVFYTGWSMSAQTKHPDRAYELIRFLCGRDAQVQQGRAGLAIPSLRSVAESDDFLRPPGGPPRDGRIFLDAVALARLPLMPEQTELPSIIMTNTDLALVAGRLTPMQAAERTAAEWAKALHSPLRARAWPAMPWRGIGAAVAAVLAAGVAALVVRARRETLGPIDRATERSGLIFVLPWVIGFTLFTLGPMVVSLLLAFSRWSGLVPLGQARFVGLTNFRQLFTYDPLFFQSLKVTTYFVLLGVPVSQVAALGIAMLMNHKARGIAVFRTIYFVPSVVSGAALAVLWLQLFNNDYGLINRVLRPLTHAFGKSPPNWFGFDVSGPASVNDAARWAVPGFVLMGLWGVGGGMIIYLAGLKGISPSLYEAARIDGAGPLRRSWNVTLPMLSPLIFYNLVMGVIGSFQVFAQAYVMTGDTAEHATLFYVLNLYQQAFEFHNMGYASAMAWVLFVIVLGLTLAVFQGGRRNWSTTRG